jgi:hypothetical protein
MDLQFSDKLRRVSTSRVEHASFVMHLLCQLWRFHLGFDDLQSDCTAAEMVVPHQLRAMAYSEATLPQLRPCLILQAFWIAHHLGRCISMDRRGRHWAMGCRKCVIASVGRGPSEHQCLLVRWWFLEQPLRYPRPLRFRPNPYKSTWCTCAQLLQKCCRMNKKNVPSSEASEMTFNSGC